KPGSWALLRIVNNDQIYWQSYLIGEKKTIFVENHPKTGMARHPALKILRSTPALTVHKCSSIASGEIKRALSQAEVTLTYPCLREGPSSIFTNETKIQQISAAKTPSPRGKLKQG